MSDRDPRRSRQATQAVPAIRPWSPRVPTEPREVQRESSWHERIWTRVKQIRAEHCWVLLLTFVVGVVPWFFIPISGGSSQAQEGGKVAERQVAPAAAVDSPPQAAGEGGAELTSETIHDLASHVLETIIDNSFQSREDVATGRFLHKFDSKKPQLSNVDATRLEPRRRGKRWVQVDAPYLSASRGEGSSKTVRLRLVDDEGSWKLENFKLLP